MNKIAILSLDPGNGGGILHSLKALYKFCGQYFDPTVFFLDFDTEKSANLKRFSFSSSVSSKQIFGMNCRAIGARWAFWEPGHYSWTLKDWDRELSEFKYFIVTSGTAIAAHPLALLDKKFVAWLATPIAGDRQGRSFWPNPIRLALDAMNWNKMLKIEQEILSKVSFLLPMSSYAKKEFDKISKRTDLKSEVCGYPLEIPTNSINSGQDQRQKKCVSIARFSDPRKDPLTLLKAWDCVCKIIPEAVLQLVGTPPEPKILSKFKNLMDSGNLKLSGLVDEQKKFEILSNSNLAIISSLQEGLGIAGLEAASFGLPVVSTDCGGPSDYVIDGLTGFVVPVGDYQQLADRIVQVLKDKKLSAKMGEKAKVLTGYFYSQEMIYKKFKMAISNVWPELSTQFSCPKDKKENSEKELAL